MSNDCKPRYRVLPTEEPSLPTSVSCNEDLPTTPRFCDTGDGVGSLPVDPCSDSDVERGWYNNPVDSPCGDTLVKYADFFSNESQAAADAAAEQCAYGILDAPIPPWDPTSPEGTIVPSIDVYGSFGLTAFRSEDGGSEICALIAFCNGPVEEGVTMVTYDDRYRTRWRAKLEGGYIYYGRVDRPWVKVASDLYPDQLTDVPGLGFSFDANAKPVFATQRGENDSPETYIEIRRYVDDVPTIYTFTGTGPKLFFNGVLQRENYLWDVVCYYCNAGSVCERFQRDNFTIEYELYKNPLKPQTTVRTVDEGSEELVYRMALISTGDTIDDGTTFITNLYPPWPIYKNDPVTVTTTIDSDISYEPVIVTIYQDETSAAEVTIGNDVNYIPVIAQLARVETSNVSVTIHQDIDYFPSILIISRTESSAVTASIGNDLDYYPSVVGLTNSESAAVGAVINSDINYTV